jgi:hypothetical protein
MLLFFQFKDFLGFLRPVDTLRVVYWSSSKSGLHDYQSFCIITEQFCIGIKVCKRFVLKDLYETFEETDSVLNTVWVSSIKHFLQILQKFLLWSHKLWLSTIVSTTSTIVSLFVSLVKSLDEKCCRIYLNFFLKIFTISF